MGELEDLRSIVDRQEDQLFRYGITMLRLLAQFERIAEGRAWDRANARRSLLAETKRAKAMVLRQRGWTVPRIAREVKRSERTVKKWLHVPEKTLYPSTASDQTIRS